MHNGRAEDYEHCRDPTVSFGCPYLMTIRAMDERVRRYYDAVGWDVKNLIEQCDDEFRPSRGNRKGKKASRADPAMGKNASN